MIAHIAGLPVEEVMQPLLGGVGVGVLLAVSSVGSRLRRRRSTRGRRPQTV